MMHFVAIFILIMAETVIVLCFLRVLGSVLIKWRNPLNNRPYDQNNDPNPWDW